MHWTRLIRRAIFGGLLVLAVAGGWFLRGWQLSQRDSNANIPLSTDAVPLSSRVDISAVADFLWSRNNPQARENLLRLTAGLRPGRGQPIPDAADVHELPVIDVSFYNWRGELLSGWLSLTTPGAPVIILTHGTPGNRASMISRAAFLHNDGFNVLLFDFQSYGKSQGVMSTLGMVESEDVLAAISYLHGLPATMFSKIGVLGLSMGATAAVLAASRSEDILALVAESCPVDATRVPSDVPDEAARETDELLVREVYGVDITQARPIDVVNKLAGHTAIFFISGDADTITPLPGMRALYNAASDPRQYWIVPGAGHAQSFAVDPKDYIDRVGTFFTTYLG
jgi:uncharacterized protein